MSSANCANKYLLFKLFQIETGDDPEKDDPRGQPEVIDASQAAYSETVKAIVKAATYYNDPAKLLEASEELGEAMRGLDVAKLPESELLQTRGW